MVDIIHGLATLPTRPPTPPRDSDSDRVARPLDTPNYISQFTRQALNTPEESPSSSADYFNQSPSKRLKRVGFSPWIDYKPANIHQSGAWHSAHQIRSIPRSRDCKSSRSILKPYESTVRTENRGPPSQRKSFPNMLDDLCRQLASHSRGMRLDGYMALNNCLKAYKDVPDLLAMGEKMPLLTDYIRRELSVDVTDAAVLDTQLLTQAIKLLTIILWTPDLASLLQDDFRSFVVEKSISMLDHNLSKTLVNHYMNVLATQNFSSKVMTSDRAGRLLNALKDLTTRVKGNGVVGQRLVIYKRLLSQANSLMVTHVNGWVDHLFSGMLSTIGEVRCRALIFGTEAASSLGTVSQVSRAVLDIFNRRSSEGKKFADLLISRLTGMLGSKDECLQVPKIWSVVVVFLRSGRRQLEHWEHMRAWLAIIQKCFNSSDSQVKLNATMAWNRLIFAVSPNDATGQTMIKMLRQPIIPQLDRKMSDKHSKQAKQIAYSSYCTLLYYAFRPGSSHAQTDKFWQEYVDTVLPGNISASKIDTAFACQVVMSLLGNAQQNPWAEDRADQDGPVKPEELPRLDPKWTRIRAFTVGKLFENMFMSGDWNAVKDGDIWILQAWRSFTKAIGDAGSKEVKTSTECMGAIAQIMNLLKRFWLQNSKDNITSGGFDQCMVLKRLMALVDGAVAGLGPIAFIEKRLIKGSHDSFEVAETPSSRVCRQYGTLASPIIHLLDMLSTYTYEDSTVETYRIAIGDLIRTSLQVSTSRGSKLEVLRDMLPLTRTESRPTPKAQLILWQLIVEALELSLPYSAYNEGNPQTVAHDYKQVLEILDVGVQQGFYPSHSWQKTLEIIVMNIHQEIGVGGSVLAVIEPFARGACKQLALGYNDVLLQCGEAVFKNVAWPKSRRETENAARVLAPSSIKSKSLSANPYEHLYTFSNSLLPLTYHHLPTADPDHINEMLRGLTTTISSCPSSLSGVLLHRLQEGLAVWITDASGLLYGGASGSRQVFETIQVLWSSITKIIEGLPRLDTSQLSAMEVLIRAGLSSRHKSIVNESILLWNRTFGLVQDIEFSVGLREILLRLRRITDIEIPDLQMGDETEVDSSPLEFIETQAEMESLCSQRLVPDSMQFQGSRTLGTVPSISQIQTARDLPILRPDSTPGSLTHQKEPRATVLTPPFRHDNSQIVFAAIESSPYDLEALESQFLTDRQREVKERQQLEAAVMFPDLRSSPRPKSHDAEHELPKLYQRHDRDACNEVVMDEMSSPVLPPPEVMIDTFLGSSPTPKSRRFSKLQLDGPSSSPPTSDLGTNLRQSNGISGRPASFVLHARDTVGNQDMSTTSSKEVAQEMDGSAAANKPEEDEPPFPTQNLLDNTAESVDVESASQLVEEKEYGAVEKHFASDADIFVDAPTSPRSPSLARQDTTHQSPSTTDAGLQVSKEDTDENIATTFTPPSINCPKSEPGRPEYLHLDCQANEGVHDETVVVVSSKSNHGDDSSDQEEQISAQIAVDMERALSQIKQVSRESSVSPNTNETGPKKRKRSSGAPSSSTKKSRLRSPPKKIQVVVERRAAPVIDEEIYDCIIVAPRLNLEGQNGLDDASKRKLTTPNLMSNTPPGSSLRARKRSLSDTAPTTSAASSNQKPSRPSKKRKSDDCTLIEASVHTAVSPSTSTRRERPASSRKGSSNLDTSPINDTRHLLPTSTSTNPSTDMTSRDVEVGRTTQTKAVPHVVSRDTRSGSPSVSNDHGSTQSSPSADYGTSRAEWAERRGRKGPRPSLQPNDDILTSEYTGDSRASELTPSNKGELLRNARSSSRLITNDVGAVAGTPADPDGIQGDDHGEAVTGGGMLERLKLLMRDAQQVVLGPGQGRDIISAWMDLGRELHNADSRSVR
ncbi:MAG: hypothetical protein Q9187_003452 [Circinaria calcarea]